MKKSYKLELSSAAERDLKRLTMSVQKDIVFNHLPIIEDDPIANSKPLTGAMKGERSYHFGRQPEYRIIFYIENKIVTITTIGSRENIYKRAKRRGKK